MNEEFREVEVAATTVMAAMLGAVTASLVTGRGRVRSRAWMSGAAVGAFSGWLAGRHRIYDWRTRRGRLAFVADHSWALATTGAGVLTAGVNRVLGSPIEQSLSERQNRLVFETGVAVRPGFALSTGYVVSGAADREGRMTSRRRRLVTDHEDVHIWQARRWGPMYPVLYGVWLGGGAVYGMWRWMIERPLSRSAMAHVDAAAYYSNPFEWRAYTEDRNWPPAGVDPTLVWRRPFEPSALLAVVKGWRESRAARR